MSRYIALTVLISTWVTADFYRLDYVSEANQHHDAINGRKEANEWLLSQRNKDWGWGTRDFPETHRVLTTLYLSAAMLNETESLEYQLSVKQLELELSLVLSRFDKQISAGQLALYVNALLAVCRDPNDFYGHDIIKIIRPIKPLSVYAEALISLAVYNSGNIVSKTKLLHYFDILENYTMEVHHHPDTIAMLILALSSVMKHNNEYRFIKAHIREPLKSLKKSQKADGSFGNIYSSALVMQALIGSGDKGTGWDFHKGLDYILSQQKKDGSFGDLLATYFALPVLAGRSLVDLGHVNCSTANTSLVDDDSENRWNETISVRYSVKGDSIFSNVFTVPENSTFFDVMKIAQKLDNRYSFKGSNSSWGFYVQTIGNLTNNVACDEYWILYKVNSRTGEQFQALNGVTKEIPQNGDHYMFQYEKLKAVSTSGNNTCEDDFQDGNVTTAKEDNVDVRVEQSSDI